MKFFFTQARNLHVLLNVESPDRSSTGEEVSLRPDFTRYCFNQAVVIFIMSPMPSGLDDMGEVLYITHMHRIRARTTPQSPPSSIAYIRARLLGIQISLTRLPTRDHHLSF